MTEDEMKNRISLALKDPILQQGFEIICKENAKLKEINGRTLGQLNLANGELIIENEKLKKENAELRKRNGELAGQRANLNRWLGEAKKIIREYMRFEPMIGTCSFYSEEYEKTKTKAEQFLKEIEE